MLKNLFLALFLTFGWVALWADTPTQIHERMKERKVKINEYKDKGILGENNKGYLEVKIDNAAAAQAANDENADRKTIYEEIGRKTKATTAYVGSQRAKKIAETSAKGHWLQDQEGKWYQKK